MRIEPEILAELGPERRRQIVERSLEDVSGVHGRVAGILADIRDRGDAALLEQMGLARPAVSMAELTVTIEEIEEALARVPAPVVEALEKAAVNIRTFHQAQLDKPQWQMQVAPGIIAGRKQTPIASVGCYVPGGRAAYPSTVLMTVLPALAAGVPRVVVCTPPDPQGKVNPQTLAACRVAGVTEIYKLGGPWAVGALALGTASVAPVAKIVGPGNKFVTAAKMQVFGRVDIDSPAGPSEALILADSTADPRFLAYDFLSQVEHDPDSAAVLVTPDPDLAHAVADRIEEISPRLPRREIFQETGRHSAILITGSLEEAVEFSNLYAPEHLEIVTAEPFLVLEGIKNAGSIFLGPWAPVPVGDYASGTNHVLPTAMGARAFSGLSVDDFIKKPTFQYLTREGLASLKDTVTTLAEAEGLPIHGLCIKARFGEDE